MHSYDKKLTFQEKELEILRNAVDRVENQAARELINSPQIKKIIEIVEMFIRKKKLKTTSLNTTFKDDSGKNIDIDVKDKDKTPGEEAIHKQKIMLVRKFVSQLPDKYENLIKYRYFEELSYNEMLVLAFHEKIQLLRVENVHEQLL